MAENLCKALSVGRRDEFGAEAPTAAAKEVGQALARGAVEYLADFLRAGAFSGSPEERERAFLYLEAILSFPQGLRPPCGR